MASRNIYFEFFKISAFYSHARATGYTWPGRSKTRAVKRANICLIHVWCTGDWRERANCALKAGFLKDEAKQKQEKKNLKGNKKVQFVKVSLSLKWKTINLL
jgi:hypothetical protein